MFLQHGSCSCVFFKYNFSLCQFSSMFTTPVNQPVTFISFLFFFAPLFIYQFMHLSASQILSSPFSSFSPLFKPMWTVAMALRLSGQGWWAERCLCVLVRCLGESEAGWALIEAWNNIKANLSFQSLSSSTPPWHPVTHWLPLHLSHHLDPLSVSFLAICQTLT